MIDEKAGVIAVVALIMVVILGLVVLQNMYCWNFFGLVKGCSLSVR